MYRRPNYNAATGSNISGSNENQHNYLNRASGVENASASKLSDKVAYSINDASGEKNPGSNIRHQEPTNSKIGSQLGSNIKQLDPIN